MARRLLPRDLASVVPKNLICLYCGYIMKSPVTFCPEVDGQEGHARCESCAEGLEDCCKVCEVVRFTKKLRPDKHLRGRLEMFLELSTILRCRGRWEPGQRGRSKDEGGCDWTGSEAALLVHRKEECLHVRRPCPSCAARPLNRFEELLVKSFPPPPSFNHDSLVAHKKICQYEPIPCPRGHEKCGVIMREDEATNVGQCKFYPFASGRQQTPIAALRCPCNRRLLSSLQSRL